MKMRIVFLCLCLVSVIGICAQQSAGTLKFINYNVLHGFNNDSVLTSKYVDWVKKAAPDVIAYQELNGYTQDSLEELAKRYGHPYAVLNTGVTHPIGLTSKYPIVMVQHVTTNMWHSYLYGNINGIHFFVTHLSPFEVQLRRNDIDRVLAHAGLLPANEKIVVSGDFNALAAIDSAVYNKTTLEKDMRKSEGRREPKSGLPIVRYKTIYRNNLDNGRLDYTVTDRMVTANFIDAYYLKNKTFKHSAPTGGHKAEDGRRKRIDYIWVNKAMGDKVKTVDILQDKETDNLSDHYPVVMTFDGSK
jgi:exodeoxyribonuclease III